MSSFISSLTSKPTGNKRQSTLGSLIDRMSGQTQQQHQQQPYGQQSYGQPQQYGGHVGQPGGYPPQQQHPPYGAPQGYPPQGHPHQQPYAQPQPGYPPQGHSPNPPHGGYAPPQGHSPYPQQQQQQPYGALSGQYTGAPGGFQQPPPQHYAPPAQPTLGYDPRISPPTDMNQQAVVLRDSMKGFGTNEAKLIQALVSVPDAPHMLKLRHTYNDRFRRDLLKDIESETSGYFRQGLMALARGPLLQDSWQVDHAIRGIGTKEQQLDDVVLGRSNADLMAIKACYSQVYKKDMAKEISDDLSLKTEKLFQYVLECRRAEESAPIMPQEVEHNVDRLQSSTAGTKFGTNQDVVCQIMAYSSDGMIRSINQRYQAKYRLTLDELFSTSFSGHMKDALRLMAARAIDPIKSAADQLEQSMKGLGTKDELLVTRLVRAHWNKDHMRQVKIAYQKFHGRDLASRVSGETSGDYKRLMVALCQ